MTEKVSQRNNEVLLAVLGIVGKTISTIIIGMFAVAIAALVNTTIGKVLLIGFASWIAVNICGIDVTDLEALKEMVKNDPSYAVEFALDWIL